MLGTVPDVSRNIVVNRHEPCLAKNPGYIQVSSSCFCFTTYKIKIMTRVTPSQCPRWPLRISPPGVHTFVEDTLPQNGVTWRMLQKCRSMTCQGKVIRDIAAPLCVLAPSLGSLALRRVSPHVLRTPEQPYGQVCVVMDRGLPPLASITLPIAT